MSRETEEKISSTMGFVRDCEARFSRFGLNLHMRAHVHFLATGNHGYNEQSYNCRDGLL